MDITDFLFTKSPTRYFDALNPFWMWIDTNRGLEKYYKEKGITDNADGLEMKNSMRHITGLARMAQAYNPAFAKFAGYTKEALDFYMDKGIRDSFVDLDNNNLGIKFIEDNPKATRRQIMDFAYQQTLNNFDKNHSRLYGYITNTEK